MVLREYFNSLPEEITLDILSRVVPTEDVLNCKSVSTDWRNIVSHDPSFRRMHTHRLSNHSGELGFLALTSSSDRKNEKTIWYFEYSENHDESTPPIERIRRLNFNPPFGEDTMFIGSCNGIICLAQHHYVPQKTFICNPITREYIMLPEINNEIYFAATGFGYVSSTNEYKVVSIMTENDFENEYVEVHIYTLGSGHGWRNLGKFTFFSRVQWEKGVFVNGALYWVDYESEMILYFDLAEEKFLEHLPPPPPVTPHEDPNDDFYELGVLDGCLSFVSYEFPDGAVCSDVWLSKGKNDNHHSMGWSEEFRVYGRNPFAITKSYDVLAYGGPHISIQDPEASISKRIVHFKGYFVGVFPHRNTLISLKEFGKEDAKIMESVELKETESHDQPFNLL